MVQAEAARQEWASELDVFFQTTPSWPAHRLHSKRRSTNGVYSPDYVEPLEKKKNNDNHEYDRGIESYYSTTFDPFRASSGGMRRDVLWKPLLSWFRIKGMGIRTAAQG
jgi:hypothetical protein